MPTLPTHGQSLWDNDGAGGGLDAFLGVSLNPATGALQPGVVVTNLGFTPVNKAGDTITGTLTFNGSVNVVLDTSTGTKIGTATNQKIGVWNATPVVRPSSITVTNYTAGARSFNRSAYTMDQLADLVCELYSQLKAIGWTA